MANPKRTLVVMDDFVARHPDDGPDGALDLPSDGPPHRQDLDRAVGSHPRHPRDQSCRGARCEREQGSPRPSDDQARHQQDGPQLGERRDGEDGPAPSGSSMSQQREGADRQRGRQEIEPQVEERVADERKADDQIREAGAPTPTPEDQDRRDEVERHLRPHRRDGGVVGRRAVEQLDRAQHHRRILDGEVLVRDAVVGRRDAVEAPNVTGQRSMRAERRVLAQRDRHRRDSRADEPHREQRRGATTGGTANVGPSSTGRLGRPRPQTARDTNPRPASRSANAGLIRQRRARTVVRWDDPGSHRPKPPRADLVDTKSTDRCAEIWGGRAATLRIDFRLVAPTRRSALANRRADAVATARHPVSRSVR